MRTIHAGPLPDEALTHRYREAGACADCYCTEVDRLVTHAEFVEAFYTTALFKLERWILRCAAALLSTDDEARALARGEREPFAAWTVEARASNQLLLRDVTGRTRSWLMVTKAGQPSGTRLYFGSVVVPVRDPKTGRESLGPMHGGLLGFHKLYSRVLLRAAVRKLRTATLRMPA